MVIPRIQGQCKHIPEIFFCKVLWTTLRFVERFNGHRQISKDGQSDFLYSWKRFNWVFVAAHSFGIKAKKIGEMLLANLHIVWPHAHVHFFSIRPVTIQDKKILKLRIWSDGRNNALHLLKKFHCSGRDVSDSRCRRWTVCLLKRRTKRNTIELVTVEDDR